LKRHLFPYLRLLFGGFQKLPATAMPKALYRGVAKALVEDFPFTYYDGGELVWLAVTSLTEKIDVLSNSMFLGEIDRALHFVFMHF